MRVFACTALIVLLNIISAAAAELEIFMTPVSPPGPSAQVQSDTTKKRIPDSIKRIQTVRLVEKSTLGTLEKANLQRDTLTLRLFPNAQIKLKLQRRSRPERGSIVLEGEVLGEPGGYATLIYGRDGFSATITSGQMTYHIRRDADGTYRVIEVDMSLMEREGSFTPQSKYVECIYRCNPDNKLNFTLAGYARIDVVAVLTESSLKTWSDKV